MSNTSHGQFHPSALAAVNEALVAIGHDATLPDLAALSTTGALAEGRKCAWLYEGARLKVLRDHNWNFARREAVAASRALAPAPADAMPFECQRPPGCVRVLECLAEGSGRTCGFRVLGDAVRSDAPVGRIVYVADVEDLDRWSPDAYRCLVLRLAADVAKPVTGRISERQLQEEAYRAALADAKLADARETNTPEDAWGRNHAADAMRGGAGAPPWPDFRR